VEFKESPEHEVLGDRTRPPLSQPVGDGLYFRRPMMTNRTPSSSWSQTSATRAGPADALEGEAISQQRVQATPEVTPEVTPEAIA